MATVATGGRASSEEAAKLCTKAIWPVGPTLNDAKTGAS
jgi:hypothetical protein